MARHYNPTISQRAMRQFNFKGGESLTDDISGPVAVIPISPVCIIERDSTTSVTGSGTVYTTPSDKDFYLTNIHLSVVKDATCDVATGSITVRTTIEGVTRNLINIAVITLTAQNIDSQLTLPFPLKVDRGVTINVNATYTVGVMVRSVNLFGYTEEVTAN